MEAGKQSSTEPGLASLVGGVVADAQELMRQQLLMFRVEVKEEFRQLRTGIVALAVGLAVAVTGALFLLVMAARLLGAAEAIPEWAGYGIVGGVLLLAGAGILLAGRRKVSDVHLVPPQRSTRELKENVAWVADRKIPGVAR